MSFIELISERTAESAFADKYTAAMSTSIQFYDHTAHNYMRAVCEDLGMRYVDGISFYMLDFMKEEKRKDLLTFFDTLFRTRDQKLYTSLVFTPLSSNGFIYKPSIVANKISTSKSILVLSDLDDQHTNLGEMISHFTDSFQEKHELINLKDIHIMGACLGWMKCGFDYNCHYNDGFKEFYNNKVRGADILVFAGNMNGRYLSSLWKTFYDRAYFWNHTPSLLRKQIANILSGPVSQNANLLQILAGNVTARQSANLVDIVSDESADSAVVDGLLERLAWQAVDYAEKDRFEDCEFLPFACLQNFIPQEKVLWEH